MPVNADDLAQALDFDIEPRFTVLTVDDNPTIGPTTVVIRYEGAIVEPMASRLAEIIDGLERPYDRVVLDLFSAGGELSHARRVVEVLRLLKAQAHLTTYVRQGAWCLSACVLVFSEGDTRVAGNASVWMFHGVCESRSNWPSLRRTEEFLALLKSVGVAEDFICRLEEKGYMTTPGDYWLSGYELFHVEKANIIERLLPAWDPL